MVQTTERIPTAGNESWQGVMIGLPMDIYELLRRIAQSDDKSVGEVIQEAFALEQLYHQ